MKTDDTGQAKALTLPDQTMTLVDVQLAEGKTLVWLSGVTALAAFLTLIPWIPAISLVLLPSTVVGLRASLISYRRLRENRRRRKAAKEST